MNPGAAEGAPGWDADADLDVDQGAAFVFAGPVTGLVQPDAADLSLLASVDDGDGLADLAVGCPYAEDDAGRLFVVPGGATGTVDRTSALVRVEGAAADFRLVGGDATATGTSCAIGDVDADGIDDVLMGASMATFGPDITGALHVFDGGRK